MQVVQHNEEDRWQQFSGRITDDGSPSCPSNIQNGDVARYFVPRHVNGGLSSSDSQEFPSEPMPEPDRYDPPMATVPIMHPQGGLQESHSEPDNHETPIQSPNHQQSFSVSDDASLESSSFQPDVEITNMTTLVNDIGQFVQALDEVTALRVASQQKRKALSRARQNVAKADEALATIVRKSRAEPTVLDGYDIFTLSDDSLQARDELGPLEDDFDTIEYQLVPKEDELKEKGEDIKRHWKLLNVEMDSSSKVASTHSLYSQDDRAAICPKTQTSDLPAPGGDMRLNQESLLRLSRFPEGKGYTQKAYVTTKSEPLIQQYAPDLSFESPWTARGSRWSPISYEDDYLRPKSVKDEDIPDVEKPSTDDGDKGKELLLGNELARLRQELLTYRARVQNELSVLAQVRESATEAQENVIEAINKALDRGTLAEDHSSILVLQAEVLRLNRDLHDQSEHLQALQRRLSTLDYQFGVKEEELYGKTARIDSSIQYDPPGNIASSSTTTSTDDDAPTLVRAYYDCIGSMDAAWHTLQEVEDYHRNEHNRRQQNISSSQSHLLSEEQFVREFFDDRAKVVKRYLRAEAEAKKFRQQCLEQKYRVDDRDLAVTPLGTYVTAKPLELLLFPPSDPQEHLLGWLEEVLRERSAATYRFPSSTSHDPFTELGQEVHPEMDFHVSNDSPPAPGTKGDLSGSSRRLSSSPMDAYWPGEKSLERRYSYPNFGNKECSATLNPDFSSRSTR
ncbi:hypothetical protein FKW77_009144 [Venturia effusa]|uniref:Uncharacterized protein n=1 Tax=Venturia effusa TaxID=50376 RepID=A0A517L1Z2_9PEZI|nr:hypothetical protein FKW77_009144 [Venturia effusa]